jgi:hypothetical protein
MKPYNIIEMTPETVIRRARNLLEILFNER